MSQLSQEQIEDIIETKINKSKIDLESERIK